MLKEIITDSNALRIGSVYRDGYVFTSLCKPNVYDAIVIRNPENVDCWTPFYPKSSHSLEEHIQVVNKWHIENVIIIAEDISFITKCPSVKHIQIIPADSCKMMDFSPLYSMEEIEGLECATTCGEQEIFLNTIDYSRINGIKELAIVGKGHLNYYGIDTLEDIWISNDKTHKDLSDICHNVNLRKLTLMQSGIKSLKGIENTKRLFELSLSYNRSLTDISDLRHISDSLKRLSIENCSKIKDFSCLYDLKEMEYLCLMGNNKIPNLSFLQSMPNLKVFGFSMEIEDGDLSLCMKLPYAYCNKSRKHYNLKDKDLPKNRYV